MNGHERERRLGYHPFSINVQLEGEALLRSGSLTNAPAGDDEESLLSSAYPPRFSDSSATTRSSSGKSRLWERTEDENRSPALKLSWKRWAFFLSGFLFFIAFFTLLLLLFFDVIHVSEENQHGGPTSPRGRFFQLSDIHLDLLYNADCNRTTFCRLPSNATGDTSIYFASPSRPWDAGGSHPYGQYGCDSPVALVKSTLKAMLAIDSNPDFILITGDISGHAQPTWAIQNESITLFTSMLRDAYPNTLVVPLLGNNDVYPDYHQPYGPNAWLEYLANLWSPWLGPEQRSTFVNGGYYSMKIPGTANLRIIALNTVLYSINFVPRNDTSIDPFDSCTSNPPPDPNDQFMWLKSELAKAQVNKEKVILAGHIPYGVNEYDGSINWCAQYVDSFLSIIYPFVEDVIINQIFAHYHLDEFRVLLSQTGQEEEEMKKEKDESSRQAATQQAVSNIMLHPSISPQHDNNPSFRYYHYYRETGAIVDYAHFYLDLALVGLTSEPRWNLEYTFQNAYSVSAVNTEAFAWLWQTIANGLSSHFSRYIGYKTALYIANAMPNLCALSSTGLADYHNCLTQYRVDSDRPKTTQRSEL